MADKTQGGKVIRFMEEFLTLGGSFHGEPFKVLDFQRDLINDIYRVDDEATVEAIQDSMDLQSYVRVEDLDHVHQRIDGLTDDLDGVMDSVGLLLMGNEQSFWADD